MDKDRSKICRIISEMLDNPTKAYDALETLVNDERMIAIGWTHADDCVDLDKGLDPRKKDIGKMLKRAEKDLAVE